MRAEFLKFRSLPTALWTGVFMVGCFLLGLIFCVWKGVGEDEAVFDLAIGIPASIATIVIGAWVVGLEFGQNTLRRVLSADPRRIRLIMAKLGAALIVVIGTIALLWLLGMLIFPLAGSGHERTIDTTQAFRNGAAVLVSGMVYVVVASGLAWITRSMAGGMTIAFVFFFVIDSIITAIPRVGDYALGSALGNVDEAIRGNDQGIFGPSETIGTEVAILAVAAWVLLIVGLGIVRTLRTEVK